MKNLMIINDSRDSIQKHESLLSKLYKYNANIYFNKQFLKRQLTPLMAT